MAAALVVSLSGGPAAARGTTGGGAHGGASLSGGPAAARGTTGVGAHGGASLGGGPAAARGMTEGDARGGAVAADALLRAGPTGVDERTGLTDAQPCVEIADFTCSYLTVPLDRSGRSGRTGGRLRLRVAVADNADAPRGVLLVLSGGPGQPGPALVPRISQRLSYLLEDYRLVMIDQRGTGAGAIDCPRLQAEVGASDVTPPSAGAVRECAGLLGRDRNFYTTSDTVADLEDLRRALGVSRWTLDGVSYGSFVATRYGLAHPRRVHRLVLDSVVPQDQLDVLYLDSLRRAGPVLRQACAEQECGRDPAAELAEVVRRYDNGVGVFDLLVIASIVDPKLTGNGFFPVLDLLHLAAEGDPGPLNAAIADLQGGENTPPGEYSAGLHVATLCADQVEAPWGDSAAPLRGRDAAVERALDKVRAGDVWPFERETSVAHGFVQGCRHWPPARPNPQPPSDRLTMPVLLINGDRDLSTPVEWAIEQAARTPRGKLVVIAGMGHSIQGRNAEGDRAVAEFLINP
ncbi:esterase [Paractinoplanes rishiriensis]|uniref:prolyl aminopeptidase n=2 Tax=Paractinoplanes rishiriensis TaxID=1050105 RepID=A0A919K2Q1_9ACTN|nr:esterase [Actinoplanes rishiriensis]